MAQVLRTYIVSRQILAILHMAIATELFRIPDCFYRAIRCMGRREQAAVRAMARCLPSTPMAQVLRTCTVSRPPLALPHTATAMELLRLAHWFYRAIPCTGRRL